MRHANSRPSGRRSDRNSGGKKQGDHLTAKSHSASAQATDIDALSRPKPAEPGTKSKHHYRTQPQKGHNRLPKGGGSVQAANRYQTRSITAQNKRNKPAGQHTKVSANKTVKPSAPAVDTPIQVTECKSFGPTHRPDTATPTHKPTVKDTNSKGPSTVRQRRQAHLEEEAAKKRKLIDEYITTGDPKVFIPFLAPFASTNSTGQHGKRRKLGEWKWDREVERHWREDKTSGEPGARIWAPVEESFI